MICTIYAHRPSYEKIKEIVQATFPKANVTFGTEDEFGVINIEIKGGLFSADKKIRIPYRQRTKLSYQFPSVDDSPLTKNLKGLFGFVTSLPASNEKVKGLFLQKIPTLNCEFSIIQEQGEVKEVAGFIQKLASELDAVVFAQPNTVISKADGQHFLDRNLDLILDTKGNSAIDHLDVTIDSIYFDNDQTQLTNDQQERKASSEQVLNDHHVKVNKNLPCIQSEEATIIRSPFDIAQRVSVLAVTNLVAFNSIGGDQAINYLKKYNLWGAVTPKEQDFLSNPTDDKKSHETWKCEGIWTLLWALNKVDSLGFPNQLCELGSIPADNYPVAHDKDPNVFIHAISSSRSKREILDANDLYYRLDWACVDTRMRGAEMKEVHPGVVYERHYALNWLITYMDQDWDDVRCDT